MKRPLLVFAGQSNMEGAPALPPKDIFELENSYEYLHKPRRFGAHMGVFKKNAYPAGEFSYIDMKEAYGDGASVDAVSSLANYTEHTFFSPAMSNADDVEKKTIVPFQVYSEADFNWGPTVAPMFARELERCGYICAYAHIAKGGVPVEHYLGGDATDYFLEKSADFFSDSEKFFPDDDTSERILLWHQGEADPYKGYAYYKDALHKLWESAKSIGFTKFFIFRVGYWGCVEIADIMRAQEDFCKEVDEAYIITRAASFFEYPGQDTSDWFAEPIADEYKLCRDSFYGFDNNHINEKGFQVLAKHAVPNAVRIIFEGKEPLLEKENILPLID